MVNGMTPSLTRRPLFAIIQVAAFYPASLYILGPEVWVPTKVLAM